MQALMSGMSRIITIQATRLSARDPQSIDAAQNAEDHHTETLPQANNSLNGINLTLSPLAMS